MLFKLIKLTTITFLLIIALRIHFSSPQ